MYFLAIETTRRRLAETRSDFARCIASSSDAYCASPPCSSSAPASSTWLGARPSASDSSSSTLLQRSSFWTARESWVTSSGERSRCFPIVLRYHFIESCPASEALPGLTGTPPNACVCCCGGGGATAAPDSAARRLAATAAKAAFRSCVRAASAAFRRPSTLSPSLRTEAPTDAPSKPGGREGPAAGAKPGGESGGASCCSPTPAHCCASRLSAAKGAARGGATTQMAGGAIGRGRWRSAAESGSAASRRSGATGEREVEAAEELGMLWLRGGS
mmetsp:Transcript_10163/g.33656  ORF Transcript_10163/g.33656 Transcript_10163/m.33656 type:complete len:274 (+) Transcript_10163:835-1656(+)